MEEQRTDRHSKKEGQALHKVPPEEHLSGEHPDLHDNQFQLHRADQKHKNQKATKNLPE